MTSITSKYTPAFWGGIVFPYAFKEKIPLEFLMAGLIEESGGNPCAIGNPAQYGPDGAPREMGIFQLYNPDDLQYLKITSAPLRAYCSPNKVPYRQKDGTTILGPSQEVIRDLTPEELGDQVKWMVAKVSQMRGIAAHACQASGVQWPADGVDFWRLVKLVHGLPGLVANALPAVTKYLGHAPSSWKEYRTLVQSGTVKADTNTERYRGADGFAHVFDNAEAATRTMQGKAIA